MGVSQSRKWLLLLKNDHWPMENLMLNDETNLRLDYNRYLR